MGCFKDIPYGVGGKLLNAIKSFYEEASACVKISGEVIEHFEIKVGVSCHHGCSVFIWMASRGWSRREGDERRCRGEDKG